MFYFIKKGFFSVINFKFLRFINQILSDIFGFSCITNKPLVTYTRENPYDRRAYIIKHLLKKKVVIIEVGAWEGHLSSFLLENLTNIQALYLVEPMKEKIIFLKNKFRTEKKIFYHNIALTNDKKLNHLYVMKESQLSSLLKPKSLTSKSSYSLQKIKNLSGLKFSNIIRHNIDVLFLNTQGSEFDILKSFKHKIKQVKIIFIEFDLKKRYSNNEELSDIFAFFESKNFFLFDVTQIKNKKNSLCGINFVELCFVNKNLH